jgi:hypothetical protein
MELIPSALTLLFQAVVTMMTIGYGDITPISVEEKIVTVILILIGATMFAYFLGVMSAIITSGRPNSTLHQFVSVSSNLVQLISSKSALSQHAQNSFPPCVNLTLFSATGDSRKANISKKLAEVDEFIAQHHLPRY